MGKRKWKRVRLVDLADAETQNHIFNLITQANQPPELQFSENRPSTMPQVEREDGPLALSLTSRGPAKLARLRQGKEENKKP